VPLQPVSGKSYLKNYQNGYKVFLKNDFPRKSGHFRKMENTINSVWNGLVVLKPKTTSTADRSSGQGTECYITLRSSLWVMKG
jgi:hypothetical protein